MKLKNSDYLTAIQTFYLKTIDSDKPKCRPIGFHLFSNETLYFVSAISKMFINKSKLIQMQKFVPLITKAFYVCMEK